MSIKFKNYITGEVQEINAVKKNTATSSNTIPGVDSSITDKAYNSTYNESDDVKNATAESGTALNQVKNTTNKDQIVSDDTWNSLNKKYTTSNAVRQADSYLNSQLSKIQSGKTSYSDQVRDMIDTIMNREKFVYDVDNDVLFQQALASAMGSGKQAMQDTIGQASALTGGYGSTYATNAANQAYNAFVEDAYNNLPQYYQMALDAYNAEGENLYNQYAMLSDADNAEYQRMLNAYDATFQRRNQLYNEDYTQFRDSKNDAYNSANLQMSEHGQLANDAMNYYNATSDYANTLYEREYNKWADEVNRAMMWVEFGEGVRQYNQDYNFAVDKFNETVRQYNENLAEEQRQYNQNYSLDVDKFNETVRQYNENLAEEQRQFAEKLAHDDKWNQAELGYKYSALEEDKRQFNFGKDLDGDGVISKEEEAQYMANTEAKKVNDEVKESYYEEALKAYNLGGMDGVNQYLNRLKLSDEGADLILDYIAAYDFADRTYTQTDDGVVVDNFGYKHDLNKLPESVRKQILASAIKAKK